jgi:hypothetical protein
MIMIRRHIPLIAGVLSMLLAWAVPLITWQQLPPDEWQGVLAVSFVCGWGFAYCGWRDWSGRE